MAAPARLGDATEIGCTVCIKPSKGSNTSGRTRFSLYRPTLLSESTHGQDHVDGVRKPDPGLSNRAPKTSRNTFRMELVTKGRIATTRNRHAHGCVCFSFLCFNWGKLEWKAYWQPLLHPQAECRPDPERKDNQQAKAVREYLLLLQPGTLVFLAGGGVATTGGGR